MAEKSSKDVKVNNKLQAHIDAYFAKIKTKLSKKKNVVNIPEDSEVKK